MSTVQATLPGGLPAEACVQVPLHGSLPTSVGIWGTATLPGGLTAEVGDQAPLPGSLPAEACVQVPYMVSGALPPYM